MTIGALNNGFSEGTQLDCSSGLQVGNCTGALGDKRP